MSQSFSAVDRITASLSPAGRHKLFRLANHLHGPPVDFAQQAGHVVRDPLPRKSRLLATR
jgi:hypothetical protein